MTLAWPGLLAKAKTASSTVVRMNAEVVKALRKPEVRERILALAMELGGNTPEEFKANMKADLATWTQALKDASIPIVTQR